MPLFSRFKGKDGKGKGGLRENGADGSLAAPAKPRWQSQWNSNVVDPEEIAELVHLCTAEMKSRAEALDTPFLLLPFRPESDPSAARTFIRNFFKANAEGSPNYRGAGLQQELRLSRHVALCSIMKWCWSRMPEGVVSWSVYEGFRLGEKESKMTRNAFTTFIPISAESEARKNIIVDFFDLLAAIAAHGKMNGLGGRKLSRLAGWWAFAHTDDGKGFEGGYRSWTSAADATSHLFFAYLRSLSPDADPSLNVIERIPRSLQALLASTEYPPEPPSLLQRATPRVVMMVDAVSPTPFALLRRAKNFEYRDKDQVLRELAEFEDPVDALTAECKRVLYAIASTNQSVVVRSRHGNATNPDQSWSTFQNLGFSDIDERALSPTTGANSPNSATGQGIRSQPKSRNADVDRPTTPSWADFLSSGFVDDDSTASPTLKYPPSQVLPPLASRTPTPSPTIAMDENLTPGELAAVTSVELDDAFWWVWMTSLAGEEPSDRKAVFGRCALIETSIMNGRWLIMEEQVKGASPDPTEGVYIAPKKGLFSSLTKRGRLSQKRTVGRQTSSDEPQRLLSATPSKTSIAPSQTAKIRAAAAALTRKPEGNDNDALHRRGRVEDAQGSKTNSMLTPGLQSEAGPAMKWTSAYDKNAIRAQYLGDSLAGKGISREDLFRKDSSQSVTAESLSQVPTNTPSVNEPVRAELPTQQPSANAAYAAAPVVVPELPRPAESSVPTTSASVATTKLHEPIPSASEAPATQHPALSAFEKEISVDSPPSPTMQRKPVPRPDNHPAFRQARLEEQTKPTPQPSPASSAAAAAAAAAAQRAMQPKTVAPAPSSPSAQRKQPTTGGLKKLFGKKPDGADHGSNGTLSAPSEGGGVGRRLSLMRKKAPVIKESAPAPPPIPVAAPEPTAAFNEPTLSAPSSQFDSAPSQTMAAELPGTGAHEDSTFSRFDQGPLPEMPSATPEDTESEASPTPNRQYFEAIAPPPLTAALPTGLASPLAPVSKVVPAIARTPEPVVLPSATATRDYAESEMSMEDTRDLSVVQDRWAATRERAAGTSAVAAPPRQSEEQSVQSRMSQGGRTDDGETSGEETIESRVARIKARVAQLTGNMDSAISAPT